MPLILFFFLVYVMLGWSLPAWLWGTIPIVLGCFGVLGGLLGLIGSFRSSSPTAGLGSVIATFFGIVLILFGLVVGGHAGLADACFHWLKSVNNSTIIISGLVIGFILAAFVNRQQ